MIAVPFIYFTFLFVIQYLRNHRQIDLVGFILLIYAISGYFSIQIDVIGLRSFDTQNYTIGIIPTFIYCSLITFCLWPFAINSSLKIKKIRPLENSKWLKMLAWLSFSYFLFSAFMSADATLRTLTGDMGALRNEMYQGTNDEGWMSKLSPIARSPFSLINMILGSPWILQLFAFFSILVQKLPTKYGILFLVSSCLSIMDSIIGADRSGVAYWILSLCACFLLFKPYMTKKQKRYIILGGVIFIGLFSVYLFVMTISRFDRENSNTSSMDSLISYLGQSFINFCYFFDEYECPKPTLGIIFPFLSGLVLGPEWGHPVSIQETMTLLSGKFTGVFYTYLGHILISSNIFIVLLYCIFFVLLAFKNLQVNKCKVYSLKKIYLYYLFGSVLFLGLFTHYYAAGIRTFSIVFFYFFIRFIDRRNAKK